MKQETKDILKVRKEEKLSSREIAKLFNKSDGSVSTILSRYGKELKIEKEL